MVRPLVITDELRGRGEHWQMDVRAKDSAWRDVRAFGADPSGGADSSVAIQRAIDHPIDGAHGIEETPTIWIPPGVYRIGTPLQVREHTKLCGVPMRSRVVATEADQGIIDISGVAEPVRHVHITGIKFEADAAGCYGIIGPPNTIYASWWRLRDCDFDRELRCCVAIPAMAQGIFERCSFGFTGAAAGVAHQAVAAVGSTTAFPFTNQFYGCYFASGKGVAADIEYGLGHNLQFYGCTFEVMTTRVLKLRGMTTTILHGCNFEAIHPSDAPAALFDIGTDAHGASLRCFLDLVGCRFSLIDGHATEIVYHDNYGHARFQTCNLTMPNMHWSRRTDASLNRGISLYNNLQAGSIAGLQAMEYRRHLLQHDGEFVWQIGPRAAPGGAPPTNVIYLDDGTNTGIRRVGFRRYDGSTWRDLVPGGLFYPNFGGTANPYNLTEAQADASHYICENTSGAADLVFPSSQRGRHFSIRNVAAHAVTVKVSGAAGSAVAAGKVALFVFEGADVRKIYEEP